MATKKSVKSLEEILEIYSRQLDGLTDGSIDRKDALACASIGGRIISTVALQMRYNEYKKAGGKQIKIMENN